MVSEGPEEKTVRGDLEEKTMARGDPEEKTMAREKLDSLAKTGPLEPMVIGTIDPEEKKVKAELDPLEKTDLEMKGLKKTDPQETMAAKESTDLEAMTTTLALKSSGLRSVPLSPEMMDSTSS